MFNLDRSKNDTSVMLDLLRAAAAQAVCIGHAINFGSIGYTYVPNNGVMLFFTLSGFLIAFTLDGKSISLRYTIIDYTIERVSRIYTAYLPALLLIGAATILTRQLGIEMRGDPTDFDTFLGNIFMLQNLPNQWGVSTFGTAGHLSSVAAEFHIYFFVGGIYFLLRRRTALLSAVIAFLFAPMPLAYFTSSPPGSDQSLFVLWLLGFASYFIANSIRYDGYVSIFALVGSIMFVHTWISHRTPGDDYNLRQYPMFALAFLSLVVFTQTLRIVPERLAAAITFFADYSFSLFLIHLTTLRIVYTLLPQPTYMRVVFAVVLANLLAILFALAFERHYRRIARAAKEALKRVKAGFAGTETREMPQ